MKNKISIAIIGSINLDIVATVNVFPRPGETITNAVVSRFGGGKGANQALAAHRLGAQVFMVGRVGNDPAADEALQSLVDEDIDLTYCKHLDKAATGLALILVSTTGENQIVVAPGANAQFHPETLEIPATDAMIAQLEVPIETIYRAASESDSFFCLNAAPARTFPARLLQHVDLLVVNEIEAGVLRAELDGYHGLLAITYGGKGAILLREGKEIARARPPKVKVVDTTGAGDAFTAALTLALVSGMPPQDALQQACLVGALTTRKMGAQSSPNAAQVNKMTQDLASVNRP